MLDHMINEQAEGVRATVSKDFLNGAYYKGGKKVVTCWWESPADAILSSDQS